MTTSSEDEAMNTSSDDEADDDPTEPLCEGAKQTKGYIVRLPCRVLALAAAALAVCSYAIIGVQCVAYRRARDSSTTRPVLTRWRVKAHSANLTSRPGGPFCLRLSQGEEFEVYGDADGKPTSPSKVGMLHTTIPAVAVVHRSTSELVDVLGDPDAGAFCPWFGVTSAPATLVVAQCMWNAAMIAPVSLAPALFFVAFRGKRSSIGPRCLFRVFLGMLLCLMPLATYPWTPGGFAFLPVVLALCGAAAWKVESVSLQIVDSGTPGCGTRIVSMELVGFLCMLASSQYNYAQQYSFPYWGRNFKHVDSAIGLTLARDLRQVVHSKVFGGRVPSFVAGNGCVFHLASFTGDMLFWLWWGWIPFLYIFYFTLLFIYSQGSPGRACQQILCILCIGHFLFLTDLVDYKFGRGLLNEHHSVGHAAERLVWRVSVVLPLFQCVSSGHWRHAGSRGTWQRSVGTALHYYVLAWLVTIATVIMVRDVPHTIVKLLYGHEAAVPFWWPIWKVLTYFEVLKINGVLYFILWASGFACRDVRLSL